MAQVTVIKSKNSVERSASGSAMPNSAADVANAATVRPTQTSATRKRRPMKYERPEHQQWKYHEQLELPV